MWVAKEFGLKFPTVGNLPVNLLYRLAAPSTPPQVKEAAVAILERRGASAIDDIRLLIRSQRLNCSKQKRDDGLNDPSGDRLLPSALPKTPTIATPANEGSNSKTTASAPVETACFVGHLSDEPSGMPKGCWTLDALVGPTIVRLADAMTSDPVAAGGKAAFHLEQIKRSFRAVVELVNDRLSAAPPLTAEQRGTINAGNIALAAFISEDVDPFPGLTGTELADCLERAGIPIDEVIAKSGWDKRYFPANLTSEKELPLRFKNAMRPLRAAIDAARANGIEQEGAISAIEP
jgi:hypothetical protein